MRGTCKLRRKNRTQDRSADGNGESYGDLRIRELQGHLRAGEELAEVLLNEVPRRLALSPKEARPISSGRGVARATGGEHKPLSEVMQALKERAETEVPQPVVRRV